MRKNQNSLKPGTLMDDYRLLEKLGGGGFSIVYLARHRRSGKPYVIKEYIPKKLAIRQANGEVVARSSETETKLSQGRQLFLQEASTLANLKHPNIVNVVNFFRANGTVYMVMEYTEGANLQDYLKKYNGGLTEKFLRVVFPRLLKGLKLIHENDLLHLDIKPGNIHIRRGGRPLLLDFGAVHGFPQSRSEQPGQVISPGFSPIEQYDARGYVGPWTDIYAFGATMRTCIEGTPPPPASERRVKDRMRPALKLFRKNYSANLLEAIDWAMEIDPEFRPQSVSEFRKALHKEVTEEDESNSALDWLTRDLFA
ncbi:MAG: serine/threonine-protein kinase [Gammaproteobacteria bacterium]